LEEACATGGTGWPLFDFGIKRNASGVATSSGTLTSIPVACKTGTAEFGDPQNRTHAWFTTFAPVPPEDVAAQGSTPSAHLLTGDPELSITVLVEGAGEGSNVAAPVAKTILTDWFSR
jgi:cell division protein FtsI/penicillin-binding protein 2